MAKILIYIVSLVYLINATDIWYYEPTATTSDWATTLPAYTQITGNTICPGTTDNCWELKETDQTVIRITDTTGFTNIVFSWSMATDNSANGQRTCHVEYSLTGNEPYVYTDIITINSKNYDSPGTYNGWGATVNDVTNLRIRLRNKSGSHSCYYNQLRLVGTTSAPSKSPTVAPTQQTSSPTSSAPTQQTSFPTTTPTTSAPTIRTATIKSLSRPLNHNDPSVDGATVTILKDVTISNNEWLLNTSDEIGFNLLLELDTSWAFSSTYDSEFHLYIYSDQPIATQTDMIVAFSQNDNSYFATNIELDEDNGHDINPRCLYDPDRQNYLTGNIQTIVSVNNGYTIFQKAIDISEPPDRPMFPIWNFPTVNYPLIFSLYNYPSQNHMEFEYNNPGDSHDHYCQFKAMIPDVPLKIYFAGEDMGAYIKYFHFNQTYFNVPTGTSAPSNNPSIPPTKFPTKTPSKNPSKYPSKFPTLFPTISPSKNPSIPPSISPTNMPSKTPTKTPTRNPSKTGATLEPTKSPTNVPTKYPTKLPSKYPSLSPSNNPSIPPTKYPTKYPSKTPTNNPSISPNNDPTQSPTNVPSKYPSKSPIVTTEPSVSPTTNPSITPTNNPLIILTTSFSMTPLGDKATGIGGDTITWIIILIIGFIILCCVITFVILYYYKRRKSNNNDESNEMKMELHQLQSITAADSPTATTLTTPGDGELNGTIDNHGEGGATNTTKDGDIDVLPNEDVDEDGDGITTNDVNLLNRK